MKSLYMLLKKIRVSLAFRTRIRLWKGAICETYRLNRFLHTTEGQRRLFYLGRTENNNLGDNGQYFCILNWIKKNYPDYSLYMAPATHIVCHQWLWMNKFVKAFNVKTDIIVFQSGYCTLDFGGNHTLMHELICNRLPDARILMMPQTIFFQYESNKRRISKNHNRAKKMLFLSRDKISYEMAKQMFPSLKNALYPDIVTTLIGKYNFKNNRDKIYLCCRNDEERFYQNDEIELFRNRLLSLAPVEVGDTQSSLSGDELRKDISNAIVREIEKLSRYKVVVTDRYHGTIYALCANTPVIILKTKDHKVLTGAEWFNDIYKGYVYVSSDLEDAFVAAEKICRNFDYANLKPFFEEAFYDKLKDLFES